MHYKEHLVISGIVNGLLLFILYGVFGVDFFQVELIIPLMVTVYIFSILPDIDHPASHISGILYLFVIYLFGSSIYDFYKTLNPMDLLKIALAIGIFIIHIKYAEDSYLHRRFPHTFTFGVLACIILYFLVNSILVTIIGLVSFVTHILCDGHIYQAIERDKSMWKLIGFKISKIIHK